MPDFELHADYDRDGRLSGSAAERAARLRFPGAILVPNLDYDRRTLPASVSLSPVPSDAAGSLPGQDDELLRIELRGNPVALGANERLELQISNGMHVRLVLQDRQGSLVPHGRGRPEIFALPRPTAPVTVFFLSVTTIAGARFGRTSTLERTYRPETREERDFTLTLVRVNGGGAARREDQGHFSVASVILDDRLSPARRLYIVDKGEDNKATREDVDAAARAAGVTVVPARASYSGGDTWFQDQFQHGYMEGADGIREIILHLPRLKSDSSVSTVSINLGNVVEGYFRAQNIALYSDMWDRVIVVRDASGRAARIGFRALRVMVNQISQLSRAAELIDKIAASRLRNWQPINQPDWVQLRRALPGHVSTLDQALRQAVSEDELTSDSASDALTGARSLLRVVERSLVLPQGAAGRRSITVTIDRSAITFTDDIALKLGLRAEQMHSGANYGGNIEGTPPVQGARLGKIIVGNATFRRRVGEGEATREEQWEFMDPDLLNLLAKQKKQPIVEVDTSWLKVGHIDEIVSVVPHGRGSNFALLHASSKAALAILRQAEARHLAGRGQTPPASDAARQLPTGRSDRLMETGSAPVTRMLRGKFWLQHQARPTPGNIQDVIAPPGTYLQIAGVYGDRQRRLDTISQAYRRTIPPQPGIGYFAAPGHDRKYPADITVSEMLWAERDDAGASSNDAIDTSVLSASRAVLGRAFPGVTLFPVPVLFDRLVSGSSFAAGVMRDKTTAVLPDMANMQVLNGHILVPRPQGPRMRPGDAVAVVQAAMTDAGTPSQVIARVSTGLISAHRLAGPYRVWVQGFHGAELERWGAAGLSFRGLHSDAELVEMFRDSFPGASDARLRREILTRNRDVSGAISGSGRGGHMVSDAMRVRLHDRMVDLFELWMVAIAAELGVTIHFVDTWFYHLRDGQVHCGTNVLRTTARGSRPAAWDVADTIFRGRNIRFQEGERVEAGS